MDEDTIEKLDEKIEECQKKKTEISSIISKIVEERSKRKRNRDIIFDRINMEIIKINNYRNILLNRYDNLAHRFENENLNDDERSRIENSLDKMSDEYEEFGIENNNAIEKYRDDQRKLNQELKDFNQETEYHLKKLNQLLQMYILEVRRLVNKRFTMSREDENNETKMRKIGGKRKRTKRGRKKSKNTR